MSNKKNTRGQLWVRILCIVLCALMCMGAIVLIVESMKSVAAQPAESAEPSTEISVGVAYGDEVLSAFSMCNPGGFSVSISDGFAEDETALFDTSSQTLAFAPAQNLYKPAKGDGYDGYHSDPAYATLIGGFHIQITSFSIRTDDVGADNPVPIFPESGSSPNPDQSGYSYTQALNRLNDLNDLQIFDDVIYAYPVCTGERFALRVGNFDTKEKAQDYLELLQKSIIMRAEITEPGDGSVSMIDYQTDRVLLALSGQSGTNLCIRTQNGEGFSGITGDSYYGYALISPQNAGIGVVNRLRIEDFVKCTLPTVVSPDDPPEMIKAFAVIVRTNVLSHMGTHRAQGFDFCAHEDHCGRYSGRTYENAVVTSAVQSTTGQYLTNAGKPIHALYAYAGAKTTADAQSVYGTGSAYLSVCTGIPFSAESKKVVLSPYDLYQILSDAGYGQIKANVKSFECRNASGSDYVEEIFVTDILGNSLTVSGGREIMRVFGAELDSLCFTCEISTDAQTPGFFAFTETGSGNGLGITLKGARAAAGLGNDYKAILSMYYKQLTLAG